MEHFIRIVMEKQEELSEPGIGYVCIEDVLQ